MFPKLYPQKTLSKNKSKKNISIEKSNPNLCNGNDESNE